MRAVQRLRLIPRVMLATLAIGALMAPAVLSAKELPTDRCALLPASELQKVVGGTFGAPGSSVAPPAFAGLPPGTECDYTAGGAGGKVVFIVYVDPSAAKDPPTTFCSSLAGSSAQRSVG